ncbi:MAG: response regulator [bacterium]|nr:response regulator [bacterium]
MEKVLVVEDELSLQKAIVDVLGITGYTALGASDGEEGLLLAQKEKPDLILLDIILPKMNGFDVLKRLKEDETTKAIPVIMLTNLESSGDIEQALSLGAMTYLVKTNYELDDIMKRVKDTLAKAKKAA